MEKAKFWLIQIVMVAFVSLVFGSPVMAHSKGGYKWDKKWSEHKAQKAKAYKAEKRDYRYHKKMDRKITKQEKKIAKHYKKIARYEKKIVKHSDHKFSKYRHKKLYRKIAKQEKKIAKHKKKNCWVQ